MLWQFLQSALRYRRGRLLLAAASLAVAATLATTLFSLYSGVDRRIRTEFQGFGANLVMVAAPGSTLPLEAVTAARAQQAIAAPVLLTTTRINDQEVAVSGIDFTQAPTLHAYWQARGARTAAPTAALGECLAGSAIAEKFNWKPGQAIPLGPHTCVLRGILSTGGPEENQIIVPFETAQQISGVYNAASLIEAHADTPHVEAARAALAAAYPQAEVRILRAVADTESQLVLSIRGALFALLLVILAITTLCVSSNFSELVLERSREIGILKAIGAAERRIAALFVSESIILSGLSAAIGYALGLFVAAAIARAIFGGAWELQPDIRVLLAVAAITLIVAVASTLFAAGRIWRIEPAVILRGE